MIEITDKVSRTSAAFNPTPSSESIISNHKLMSQVMFTDLQEIYGKNENPYCFHKIPQNKNSENGMRG